MTTRGPNWLDDREQQAWRGYMRMQGELSARLNRNFSRNGGISMADYGVLVHLSDAVDGRARVLALGRQLQWEKSRLSHQLTRMERRGLVTREECPTDRRGALARITDAGTAALVAAAPSHVADVRRYLIDPLTSDQLDVFAEVTAAVLAALADDDLPTTPGECCE